MLAVVNTKNTDPDIAYGDISIKAIQPQEAFRILGCWYTIYKNHKPVHTIIREEAESAIKKIKQSRITDKQAIYIINTVILMRIAYRVQNTCLSQRLCKLITNNYTRATKYKAGLARSVPNSTLFHHRIYGLRTVSDIQTQQHISLLNRQLNYANPPNTALKIRMQQLQNTIHSNKSILSDSIYILPQDEAKTPLANMLINLKKAGITFSNLNNWPLPKEQLGTTIDLAL